MQDTADEYHDDACDALYNVIQDLPLSERISLLKTELHGHADGLSKDGEEAQADIEVLIWLKEHYLLLM